MGWIPMVVILVATSFLYQLIRKGPPDWAFAWVSAWFKASTVLVVYLVKPWE